MKTLKKTSNIISFDYTTEIVCKHFKVSFDDVLSKDRKVRFVRPRHIIIYLLDKYTNMTMSKIGKQLGGRDPSTVSHAVLSVKNQMATNASYRKELSTIERLVTDDYEMDKLCMTVTCSKCGNVYIAYVCTHKKAITMQQEIERFMLMARRTDEVDIRPIGDFDLRSCICTCD